MSDKVAEIASLCKQDDTAAWVSNLWDKFNNQRQEIIEEWKELRNYVFATDTTSTTNSTLPWKNSTTLPKLCQIRDNLHSNYLSALFPNDDWLRWEAHSEEASYSEIARAVKHYMANKLREARFRVEASKMLYDYIDYGNVFATCAFEAKYKTTQEDKIPQFIGPKAYRISPLDIVFNPRAADFDSTFKIVRTMKSVGELKKLAMTDPDYSFWGDVVERREFLRRTVSGYKKEDFDKAVGYQADGFGSMYEYFLGDEVEILEFYGDYHNDQTGELEINKVLTIVDRSMTARVGDIPNWFGKAPIVHVGWRERPDNLWAMGPLANLVGMQYRIDHLENLKADAMDLLVHPPLVIQGEVEEFEYRPGSEIHIDENGGVTELGKNSGNVLMADSEIAFLEERMELYSGAPREAMGVRTPGEKTKFEVQTLNNAAGRIFQEKITTFEVNLLEPLLNLMLETAKRNMVGSDVIRVMDDDLGVEEFMSVTKADITASGVIRPIGARHFAKQTQDLQNLIGVMNSPLGQLVTSHTSGKQLAKFIEDVAGVKGYELFKPNVAIMEQMETQQLMQSAQRELQAEQAAGNMMAEGGV